MRSAAEAPRARSSVSRTRAPTGPAALLWLRRRPTQAKVSVRARMPPPCRRRQSLDRPVAGTCPGRLRPRRGASAAA
eukprot:13016091-Alexandrium_andersonii.AAC.1